MNPQLATVGLALDQVLINSSDRRDAKFRDRETRDGLGWPNNGCDFLIARFCIAGGKDANECTKSLCYDVLANI